MNLFSTLLALAGATLVAGLSADDLSSVRPIGTGLSQAKLTMDEQLLFEHHCSEGDTVR